MRQLFLVEILATIFPACYLALGAFAIASSLVAAAVATVGLLDVGLAEVAGFLGVVLAVNGAILDVDLVV